MALATHLRLLVDWLTPRRSKTDLHKRKRMQLFILCHALVPLLALPIPIWLGFAYPGRLVEAMVLGVALCGFWVVLGLARLFPEHLRLLAAASLLNLVFVVLWGGYHLGGLDVPIWLPVAVAALAMAAVALYGAGVIEAQALLGEKAEWQQQEIDMLSVADEEAARADIARTEYLARMSHELRTPLNSIMGYAEMLRGDAEREGRGDEAGDLRRISTAGTQMMAIVAGILEVSGVESRAPAVLTNETAEDDTFEEHPGLEVIESELPTGPDRRERVLVVDDDRSFLETAERVFSQADYLPIVTDAPQSVLQIARTVRPAAIFLDVMMPGFDGWDVLAALKRDPATADIAVFMIAPLGDRAAALAAGADGVVSKPLEAARLKATLAALRTTRRAPVPARMAFNF